MIEYIKNENLDLAVIIRAQHKKIGIEFLTPNNYSQQLGYMCRPKDYVIQPHVHNPVTREVQFTYEALFIKSGKVRVDFYNNERMYLESTILFPSDVILLVVGGHGFTMLEESEIIEIKQGPYAGDADKTRFDQNLPDKLIFRN